MHGRQILEIQYEDKRVSEVDQAMTSEHLLEELEAAISSGVPLRQIIATLRDYHRSGVTRHEVQVVLEELRNQARDEATEDRILEVLDIVSGFCSRENSVWED